MLSVLVLKDLIVATLLTALNLPFWYKTCCNYSLGVQWHEPLFKGNGGRSEFSPGLWGWGGGCGQLTPQFCFCLTISNGLSPLYFVPTYTCTQPLALAFFFFFLIKRPRGVGFCFMKIRQVEKLEVQEQKSLKLDPSPCVLKFPRQDSTACAWQPIMVWNSLSYSHEWLPVTCKNNSELLNYAEHYNFSLALVTRPVLDLLLLV